MNIPKIGNVTFILYNISTKFKKNILTFYIFKCSLHFKHNSQYFSYILQQNNTISYEICSRAGMCLQATFIFLLLHV